MKKIIRLSKSSLSNKELVYVKKVLKKEYLGMGPEVNLFEKELSKFLGRKAICTNSGTASIHLALQACGIKKGDEVIVPTLTYVATYQAISATGAEAVLCDIDPDSLCISIKDLKKKITKKTKAIIPVHFGGHPCNLEEVFLIAKEKKLRVIEDAAHAFGTFYNKKIIGSFGDITCFSFDGIKNITSGEGGCIVTNNKKIIERVSNARVLGVINESKKKYLGSRSWEFDVKSQGWRYHLSDVNAAIGRAQLKRFKNLSSKRKKLCKIYDELFRQNKKSIKIYERNYDNEVPHIYFILIKDLKHRNILRRDLLHQKGIQTGVHYFPGYKLSFYKKNAKLFPNTQKVYNKLLTLPLHPNLKRKNIFYIVKTLINFLDKGSYY